ncbi:VOC family protein, partial [Myxococcota bacterium]|nr:VOC family protein [Myxococcota bacterium]
LMNPVKQNIDLGIVVSDPTECLHFYRDILGLEKTEEITMGLGTLHRLQYCNSDVKILVPKEAKQSGPEGLQAQEGIRYFTMVISNIKEVVTKLTEENVPFEIPLTEIRPGTTIAMVRDPAGNVLEFVERS